MIIFGIFSALFVASTIAEDASVDTVEIETSQSDWHTISPIAFKTSPEITESSPSATRAPITINTSPPTTRGPPDMTIGPITMTPHNTRRPPDVTIDPITIEPVPINTRGPPDATINPITIDPHPFEPIKPDPPIPICAVECKPVVSPTCGEFDGQYQLFASPCLMLSHYCNTGEKYNQADMQNCQPPPRQFLLRNVNSNATRRKYFI